MVVVVVGGDWRGRGGFVMIIVWAFELLLFCCYMQILSPEGVLACGSWPVLKEILIYDNPLTRTSKGMYMQQ